MRIAYADPPYPGQAKRHYGGHPDYAGEVDHAELVARLGEYDGWGLSTSANALPAVLALCPSGVRVAVWHRPNAEPPGNRGTWWHMWEPVILRPARPPEIPTRDLLIEPVRSPAMFGDVSTLIGQKPPAFCRWLFALLGAERGDDFTDLFPGSRAVSHAWESWRSQLTVSA